MRWTGTSAHSERDPGYWPAINNSGNVRFALGDYGGAIENFERTLVLNPDYWPAQYNLAIVYTAMGRPDRAVPKLRIVLDWSPEFVEARYLLAVLLDRLGRGREAAEQRELLAGDLPATGFRDEDGLMPLPADKLRGAWRRISMKRVFLSVVLCLAISPYLSAQTTFYFPQIADGGVFTTTIFIANPSSSPTPGERDDYIQ